MNCHSEWWISWLAIDIWIKHCVLLNLNYLISDYKTIQSALFFYHDLSHLSSFFLDFQISFPSLCCILFYVLSLISFPSCPSPAFSLPLCSPAVHWAVCDHCDILNCFEANNPSWTASAVACGNTHLSVCMYILRNMYKCPCMNSYECIHGGAHGHLKLF